MEEGAAGYCLDSNSKPWYNKHGLRSADRRVETGGIMISFREEDGCFAIILKSLLLLAVCTGIGFLALLLVYSFPREKMKEHVFENADFYSDNYMLADGYKSTLLDMYTDTTMLSEAICPALGHVVSDALLAPRRCLLDSNGDFQLIANYTCEDEAQVEYKQYPRYWHGYLVLLKPLLIFFNIADLHLIYFFVQSILLLALLIGLVRKDQTPFAVCFGIGVLLLNPMVTALNFQNASIYFILLLSLLFLVYSGKLEENYLTRKQCLIFFQVIGMATAYFDFLTYPIVALGVPLLFLLYFSEDKDIKKRICHVILNSVLFFVGYFGMYLCKWGLATFLTDVNVFGDAYEEIMILLNANKVEGEQITIISGMAKTMGNFLKPPYLLLLTGGILYAGMISIKAKVTSTWIYRSVPVILVAIYPFCHMLAATHSFYHYHFVYREFVVTILAVLLMILDIRKSADMQEQRDKRNRS